MIASIRVSTDVDFNRILKANKVVWFIEHHERVVDFNRILKVRNMLMNVVANPIMLNG